MSRQRSQAARDRGECASFDQEIERWGEVIRDGNINGGS